MKLNLIYTTLTAHTTGFEMPHPSSDLCKKQKKIISKMPKPACKFIKLKRKGHREGIKAVLLKD